MQGFRVIAGSAVIAHCATIQAARGAAARAESEGWEGVIIESIPAAPSERARQLAVLADALAITLERLQQDAAHPDSVLPQYRVEHACLQLSGTHVVSDLRRLAHLLGG